MSGEVTKSCHILCIVRRRGGEMAQLQRYEGVRGK